MNDIARAPAQYALDAEPTTAEILALLRSALNALPPAPKPSCLPGESGSVSRSVASGSVEEMGHVLSTDALHDHQ
jgi:hypothetical protein